MRTAEQKAQQAVAEQVRRAGHSTERKAKVAEDAKKRKYVNREHDKAVSKAWRLAHADHLKAIKKAWYEANRDVVRAQKKAYYAAHRDQIQAAQLRRKDKRSADAKAWRKRNPDYLKAWKQKYPGKWRQLKATIRARNREAFVEIVDHLEVFRRANGRCAYCEKPILLGQVWYVDHIVPLSNGGIEAYINVRPLHARCNMRKSASMPTTADYLPLFQMRHVLGVGPKPQRRKEPTYSDQAYYAANRDRIITNNRARRAKQKAQKLTDERNGHAPT